MSGIKSKSVNMVARIVILLMIPSLALASTSVVKGHLTKKGKYVKMHFRKNHKRIHENLK